MDISEIESAPEGAALQMEKVVRLVYSPFTVSLKCSAKNTWLSVGSLARELSSSHLRHTVKGLVFTFLSKPTSCI